MQFCISFILGDNQPSWGYSGYISQIPNQRHSKQSNNQIFSHLTFRLVNHLCVLAVISYLTGKGDISREVNSFKVVGIMPFLLLFAVIHYNPLTHNNCNGNIRHYFVTLLLILTPYNYVIFVYLFVCNENNFLQKYSSKYIQYFSGFYFISFQTASVY